MDATDQAVALVKSYTRGVGFDDFGCVAITAAAVATPPALAASRKFRRDNFFVRSLIIASI